MKKEHFNKSLKSMVNSFLIKYKKKNSIWVAYFKHCGYSWNDLRILLELPTANFHF